LFSIQGAHQKILQAQMARKISGKITKMLMKTAKKVMSCPLSPWSKFVKQKIQIQMEFLLSKQ